MFVLFGNTIFDITLALVVIASFSFVGFIINIFLISILERISERSNNTFDDALIIAVRAFDMIFYAFVGLFFVINFTLVIPENFKYFVFVFVVAVFLFYLLKASFRVVDYVLQTYKKTLNLKQKELATILPALGLLIKITIFLFVVIFYLSNLGIDVTTLIAGLGIGGIALAFAFQKILSDIFSTFVIFFDRPFAVGDAISVNNVNGVVEKVGIKTTHIRAFTGENVVIPNEDIVNTVVSNITDRPSRKVVLTLPLSYDTSKKLLECVPKLTEEIVSKYDKAKFSYSYIRDFGEYALMFELVYYIKDATYDEHVFVRHSIYIDFLETLHKKKIELGYPIEMDGRIRR